MSSSMVLIRIAFPLALSGFVHGQNWLTARRWYDPTPGAMRATGDLDGDGDVDAVRFTNDFATATAMLNPGSGDLVAGPVTTLPSGIVAWTGPELLVDLDGDGDRDLVLAASASYVSGRGLLVLAGTGTGAFGAATFVPLPGDLLTLAEGEVNGDGVADLAIQLGPTWTAASVAWLLGSTTGAYALQPVLPLTGWTNATRVAVFDANGDGVDDLAGAGGNLLRVLHTVGTSLVPGPTFPLVGTTIAVLAADVDGDLDDDLIACSVMPNTDLRVLVAVNLAGTAYTTTSQTLPQFGYGTLLAGDLDGDGDADLLCRTQQGSSYRVLENVGAGVFTVRWQQGAVSAPFDVPPRRLDDLDGDGDLDCVEGNSIFFGSGAWASPSGTPAATDAGLVDVDRDGDVDVLQTGAVIQRNDGRGVFTPSGNAWPAPSGSFPFPVGTLFFGQSIVFAADFDGDGLLEVLVPTLRVEIHGTSLHGTRRLEHDGNGTYLDLGPATPAGGVLANGLSGGLVSIDSDDDGLTDLIDAQGLWVNNGSHHWSLLGGALTGFWATGVGDLDGDGDDDCVGLQWPANDVVVMRQVGPHTFAPTVLLAGVAPGIPPALGDLDGDGDLDVVVDAVAWPSFAFHTFVNQGGTFAPGGPVTSGTFGPNQYVSRLLVADVDGDGDNDVAATSQHLLTVLRRSGPGLTYDPPRSFLVTRPQRLVDIDQDGDLDVLGEAGAWNLRHDGPSAGSRRQYGTPALGFGARRPTCSAVGIVRPGHTPTLRLANTLGGSVALLGLGDSETSLTTPSLPGLVFYTQPVVQLAVSLTGAAGIAGAGGCDLPLALSPSLAGLSFFLQGYVLDPAAPSLFTHTNGLELRIGN